MNGMTLQPRSTGSVGEFRAELVVVFIFLSSMGFPGTYTKILGNSSGMMVEYASFFMQIGLMLMLSGPTLLEIRLISLKECYLPIYQYIVIVFSLGMVATGARPGPFITCIRYSVTILFAIWLVEHFALERLIKLFCFAQFMIDCLTVGIVILKSSAAFESGKTYIKALNGICGTKNNMGAELAFGAVLIFINLLELKRKHERTWPWVFTGIIHVSLLLATQATAAILITVIITLYILYSRSEGSKRVNIGIWYIVISIGFLFFAFTILPLFTPFIEWLGKDATLTGRTVLWDGIYSFVQENRMLSGYGYGNFWLDAKAVARLHSMFARDTFFSQMATGAHNLMFELWLNTGLVGLTSFLFAIGVSFRNVSHMDQTTYCIVSSLMFYLCVYGLTEREFGNAYTYQILVTFILLAVGCKSKVMPNTAVRKQSIMKYREVRA